VGDGDVVAEEADGVDVVARSVDRRDVVVPYDNVGAGRPDTVLSAPATTKPSITMWSARAVIPGTFAWLFPE
jgi:hypothetical protein